MNIKPTNISEEEKTRIFEESLKNQTLYVEKEPVKIRPANQWISVKDKLPDEGERVLIYAPRLQNKYYAAMFYTLRDEIKFAMNVDRVSYSWYGNDVTHWMPLPEPPKDGDTNG